MRRVTNFEKSLKGTAQKCRMSKGESVTSDHPPIMPGFLAENPRAKAWWDELVAAAPTGFYDAMDMPTLTLFCMSKSLADEAWEAVSEEGTMVTDKKGEMVPNPYLRIFQRTQQTSLKLLSHLGLSPSARMRLNMPPVAEKEVKDPFAERMAKLT